MTPPAPPPYPQPRRAVPVLVPHLIWEAVLLLVTVAVVVVAAVQTPLFSGAGIWWQMAYFGLLATGLALSLRTATPNLSVAAVATASGAGYAWLVVDREIPVLLAATGVLLGAVVLGGALGVVAGLTSVPAWAVSLAGVALAQAVTVATVGPAGTIVADPLPSPLDSAWLWFPAFLLISLAGGALLAVPPVRRLLTANRAATDPVRSGGARLMGASGGARLLGALLGFVGSSALASLAGLVMVVWLGSAFGGADLFALLLVLAAVLIGGVSGFGGRGGIAGTVLGVVVLTVAIRWLETEQERDLLVQSGRWLLIAVAILAGVALSRLMELVAPPADA